MAMPVMNCYRLVTSVVAVAVMVVELETVIFTVSPHIFVNLCIFLLAGLVSSSIAVK